MKARLSHYKRLKHIDLLMRLKFLFFCMLRLLDEFAIWVVVQFEIESDSEPTNPFDNLFVPTEIARRLIVLSAIATFGSLLWMCVWHRISSSLGGGCILDSYIASLVHATWPTTKSGFNRVRRFGFVFRCAMNLQYVPLKYLAYKRARLWSLIDDSVSQFETSLLQLVSTISKYCILIPVHIFHLIVDARYSKTAPSVMLDRLLASLQSWEAAPLVTSSPCLGFLQV